MGVVGCFIAFDVALLFAVVGAFLGWGGGPRDGFDIIPAFGRVITGAVVGAVLGGAIGFGFMFWLARRSRK